MYCFRILLYYRRILLFCCRTLLHVVCIVAGYRSPVAEYYCIVEGCYIIVADWSIGCSGSGSFHQQTKQWRKTLISNILLLLFYFLSLKNGVNVPSKRNKHKKLFLLASWRSLTKEKDPHPDPLVTSTDPRTQIRIRIRTKMSRIPNTGPTPLDPSAYCSAFVAEWPVNEEDPEWTGAADPPLPQDQVPVLGHSKPPHLQTAQVQQIFYFLNAF